MIPNFTPAPRRTHQPVSEREQQQLREVGVSSPSLGTRTITAAPSAEAAFPSIAVPVCRPRVDEPVLSAMEKTSVCASLIPSHLLKQEREKPEAHSNQQSRSDEEG